ncbi:hypothetical protein FI667_g16960, partial [Globisporangium splendens]
MSAGDYGTRVDMQDLIDANDMENDVHSKYRHAHPRRCCVRFGNTWVICSLAKDRGKPYGLFPLTWHIGPNWPCMLVTYCIALAPLLLILLRDDVSTGLKIALLVSVVLTTCAFTMVACSDPGVIFESYEPPALQIGDTEAGAGVICGTVLHCRSDFAVFDENLIVFNVKCASL